MVVVSAAAAGAKTRDIKRAKALTAKKRQLENDVKVQVDRWFGRFDKDGSASLDKEELKELLTHLHPERPPSDEVLIMLMTSSIKYGGAADAISREATMKVASPHAPARRTAVLSCTLAHRKHGLARL